MTAELARARRYGRPLSIVLVAVSQSAAAPENALAVDPASPFGPVVLASLLREVMREEDMVSYTAARQRCLVMMPEVDRQEAQQAVDRVTVLCAQRFSLLVRAGVAAYPLDGWTLEDLVRRAEAAEIDRTWPEAESRTIAAVPAPGGRRLDDPVGA
jgi:hypothetical protein